jgi:hypothetical protein
MLEKLRISNPVCPPPPVAIVRIAHCRLGTIDGEQDWKCHAAPHGKHNHHHPEISKEEITVLHINFVAENTYQSRFVDDEWIWGFEKWHNPSELCPWKWFRTFPVSQPPYSGQMNVLFRYSSNERSRFIDSLVLFPELKNRDISNFFSHVKKGSLHTRRKPTKKARKISPLTTNDHRNAETELPEVELDAISVLRNPTRRRLFGKLGCGPLF